MRRELVVILLCLACGTPGRPLVPVRLLLVRLQGESFERRLLATSLQGIVNQRSARVFLLPGVPEARGRWWEAVGEEVTQRDWLDHYRGQGIALGSTEVTLDEALRRYAGLADGFVVASTAEPWTINAATTRAGLRRWLIATPETIPALESLGLQMKADLRGRWASTDAAVRDDFAEFSGEADPGALGAISPDELRLRDYLIAHRMLTVFGVPDGEGWGAFRDVLARTPADLPVYGFLSVTSQQEDVALQAISSAGKRLVPSDTVSNLSVHTALSAEIPAARPVATGPCSVGRLHVALALSDGDNLAIHMNRYLTRDNWLDPSRGRIPVGWSVAPELVDLAPAVAARFMTERRSTDELVGMMGAGYAYVPLLPDPGPFLDASFSALSRFGMTALWVLGPKIGPNDAATWDTIGRGYREQRILGALAGYGAGPPSGWRASSGMPVIRARGSYDFGAAQIEDRIRTALSEYRAGGPSVLLINVTVWNVTYRELVAVVERLRGEPDLEFVTPSQAFQCLN